MLRSILQRILQNRVRRGVALILAFIVTFSTTYALVLPAITLEQNAAESMAGMDHSSSHDAYTASDNASGSDSDSSSDGGNDASSGGSDAESKDSSDTNGGDAQDSADVISFDAEARDTVDGETYTMQVHVEAEAGAFPEGTTMIVETVTDEAVLEMISDAVEGEVTTVHAVDITFLDENKEEVEPEEGYEVNVTMSSDVVDTTETDTTTVVQYSKDEKSKMETAAEVVTEETDLKVDPELKMDPDAAVTFTTDTTESSPVYAIVETASEEELPNGESDAPAAGTETENKEEELPNGESAAPVAGVETDNNTENELPAEEDPNGEDVDPAVDAEAEVEEDEELPEAENFIEEIILALDFVRELQAVTEDGIVVTARYVDGVLPEGTELMVTTVEAADYADAATEAAGLEKETTLVKALDITFLCDGEEIQPTHFVSITIQTPFLETVQDPAVVHMEDEDNGNVVDNASAEEDMITLKSKDFSVYVIVGTTMEMNVLASDGHNYKITVTYGGDAGVPEGASLEVSELTDESELYDEYVTKTEDALGMEEGSASNIRLFDIKIVDQDGQKVEITAPVDVKIEMVDVADESDAQVVHFADGAEGGEVVENVEVEDGSLNFAADGFSVYAIVSGPSGAEAGWEKLTSLDALTSQGYYIGHTSGYYLTGTETSKTSGEDTLSGIKRTAKKAVPTVSDAVLYYFEEAPEGNKYFIYYKDGDTKNYVVNNGDASLSIKDDKNYATAFTVEVNDSGVFKIHNGDWYWNMQTGTGEGFYAKNKANDGNNNLYLWKQTDPNADTYGLDGKTYGLMTWTGGKTAKALMAVENRGTDENHVPYSGCLEAKFLTVMTHESDAGNKLYVPNNTTDTVTTWTFEWDHNAPDNRLNSYYYLKANNGKYLKITANGLSLVSEDEKDESCLIQVKPGTGKNEGQICLKSVGTGSKPLTYSGEYAKGYNTGGTAGSEWLYLVDTVPEEVLANYEKVYTATKVSVSDTEKVNTGAKIIIYARQWKNDHYEYYAINSRGELVPCSESGDTIEWYGGNVNDMLWQFTEYVYEGTDTPNGYYELENLYARNNGAPSYLAPKHSDGTILSKGTVGVLLQGRTDQQYYSPIVAWDTPEYMYSALTVDLKQADPALKPCVRADGLDFYFAIMEDLPVDDVLHTVPTVDNDQYGIQMKMVDLSNGKNTEDMTGQMNAFLQDGIKNGKTWEHTPGLLSTNLTNGYPTTMNEGSGGSLANLFEGERVVNHLFIDSTYRATGYFEYNSAQNFASLQGSDFVVYQELGSNDTTKKDTLQHGQFFPYNDIEAGRYTSANAENLYTTTADPLPDSDPRKYEQLYLVKDNTDYFFGMELEASFVQTPSGLDAWGHDIIFEFSGDDDFWLYVDDELVIDLGGIHSAVSGTVNFRTGVVVLNPKSTLHGRTTTLLDLFTENYMARYPLLSSDAARALAMTKFEQNDAGQWVFKDNTKHTMRIFYMERGAGASNLHMKFNLASVKKGTVELHKELEGADKTETTNAWFPYQVYYRMENETSDAPERMLRNAFDPSKASDNYNNAFGAAASTDYVFYKDTTKPVTFLPELTVDGVTYYNVFMLKPEETAVLNFPVTRPDTPEQEATTVGEYRIVECGIDSSVFKEVTVNGKENSGEHPSASTNSNLRDYGIEMATTDSRPRVNYVNKVETLKNLTITKELYRKYDADSAPVKINPDGSPIGEGVPRSQQTADEETFDFRLYFKTPYDNDFSPANLHIYHVKDPEGYYCAWNSTAGCFERITADKYPGYLKTGYENGTTDYANLTDDVVDANGSVTHLGKFWASFETSPNGSIAGIPAYYTIEVRGLIPGTTYKFVERPTETPDGYKFWKYENSEGISHEDPYDPWDGIIGTIPKSNDASALVKNYKGFGLRLEKVWEDASSMQDREPAYFAVYKVDKNGDPEDQGLVPGSVRRLDYGAKPQGLYWWYLNLPIPDTGLTDYAVFEVVGDIEVDNNGEVTSYTDIVPVLNSGIVTLNGTLKLATEEVPIQYAVTYGDVEEIGDNVRKFTVTNTPAQLPHVRFVKTDWDGDKLPGADFSLRYGENLSSSLFDPQTKTSDENGLIAQVILQENVAYTLTELKSPQGYVGLDGPLTVTLRSTTSGWDLDVSPAIPSGYPVYYEVSKEDGILTLTIKNHPYDFEAVKVDSTDTDVQLSGVKFALYKQVTVGSIITWDEKNPVYTDLTTDENGVIPQIDKDLPAGTYQLRETKAPSQYYRMLTKNVDFTVSEMGVITLGEHPDGVALTSKTDDSGKIIYSMVIPNTPQPLKLVKQDNNGNNLIGAKFKLTTLNADNKWVVVTDENGSSIYDDVDMTLVSEFQLSNLPAGRYCLEETCPPDGYIILTKYIYFRINNDRTVVLTKEDGTNGSDNSQASINISPQDGVYIITVKNTPGAALPYTGGPGTRLFTILGSILILGAGVLLWRRGRLSRGSW